MTKKVSRVYNGKSFSIDLHRGRLYLGWGTPDETEISHKHALLSLQINQEEVNLKLKELGDESAEIARAVLLVTQGLK